MTLEINQIVKNFIKGEEKTAYNQIIKYLKINPNDTQARFNTALMEQKMGHTNKAIHNYQTIIKNNKDNAPSLINLYLIFIREEKYEAGYKIYK